MFDDVAQELLQQPEEADEEGEHVVMLDATTKMLRGETEECSRAPNDDAAAVTDTATVVASGDDVLQRCLAVRVLTPLCHYASAWENASFRESRCSQSETDLVRDSKITLLLSSLSLIASRPMDPSHSLSSPLYELRRGAYVLGVVRGDRLYYYYYIVVVAILTNNAPSIPA